MSVNLKHFEVKYIETNLKHLELFYFSFISRVFEPLYAAADVTKSRVQRVVVSIVVMAFCLVFV